MDSYTAEACHTVERTSQVYAYDVPIALLTCLTNDLSGVSAGETRTLSQQTHLLTQRLTDYFTALSRWYSRRMYSRTIESFQAALFDEWLYRICYRVVCPTIYG